jgi:hypothetical protein
MFKPSIPDNQDRMQLFENDEQVVGFLTDSNDSFESLDDQTHVYIPKYCISIESPFTRDDQMKIHDPKEVTSIKKVQETRKINFGTDDIIKYINLGTNCTKKEVDRYNALLK